MKLQTYVDQFKKGKDDAIAIAAVRLGVGYHSLYAWLKGRRKPGKYTAKHLASKGIILDDK